MKMLGITCLGFLLILGCRQEPSGSQPEKTAIERAVPIVRLLADPDQYNGKEIEVVGFYRQGFEEFAIYPSREMSISPSNGIWVEMNLHPIEGVKPEGSWLILRGRLHASGHGHLEKYSAELHDISKASVIDALYDIVVLGKEPTQKPAAK